MGCDDPGERAWWGSEADGFKARVETEQAWRVSLDQIKAGNFNLDLKTPHHPDDGPGDVDHLLPEYEKLLASIAQTRAALQRELALALGDPVAGVADPGKPVSRIGPPPGSASPATTRPKPAAEHRLLRG